MAKSDLRRVQRAMSRCKDADQELRDAIIDAKASGETYRDIAEAAGLSHQRVWQIVNQR
jgi:hypothetical protein